MSFSVLVAASCPPPIAGQTLATAMLLRGLQHGGIEHGVVDLSRDWHTGNKLLSYAKRGFRLAGLPLEVRNKGAALNGTPLVFYLQLGHSRQTLLRDLPLLAAARSIGARTVVHVHGSGFRDALESAPAPLRAATRASIEKVDCAIALSESLRGLFEGVVPNQNIVTVSNGVDAALSTDALKYTPKRRSEQGLSALYMSNLIDFKGYGHVLEAARIAQECGQKHRFVLCGKQTESTRIDPERYIQEHQLHNVTYLGTVDGDAKYQAFREADVFILPSTYEGQPIAILEALHYGLPVITTDAGGIPDIVTHERNGLVTTPSGDSIVHAMDRLDGDHELYVDIAKANRIDASNYTEERHTQRMIDVLADVARRQSAS